MGDGCKRFAVDLSAYFDDELDPADAAKVKAHLDGCARCSSELGKMGGLRAVLNQTGEAAVPEKRLIQDLMRALQKPDGAKGAGLFDSGPRGPTLTRER